MTVRRITLLYVLLLVVIIAIANLGLGETFRPLVGMLPGGDKTGHFLAMGMLSFLALLSLAPRRVRLGARSLPAGPLVVAMLATLEELTQLFLEHRGFDLLDLTADYLGIAVFGCLAAWVMGRGQG